MKRPPMYIRMKIQGNERGFGIWLPLFLLLPLALVIFIILSTDTSNGPRPLADWMGQEDAARYESRLGDDYRNAGSPSRYSERSPMFIYFHRIDQRRIEP